MAEQIVDETLEYLKTEKPGLLTSLVKIAECRTYDTSYPPRKLLHRNGLITEGGVLAKLTEFGAAVYEAHTGNAAVNVYVSPLAALTAAQARIVELESALRTIIERAPDTKPVHDSDYDWDNLKEGRERGIASSAHVYGEDMAWWYAAAIARKALAGKGET